MTGNIRISGNKKSGSAAETQAGKGFAALNSRQESSSGLEESTRQDKPEGAASQRAVPMVNGKVKWHHTQATGAPDTPKAGDSPTAWAPTRQSGEQWLALGYEKAVEIKEINIHETHCPGAISKVAALAPDGSEKVLWRGTAAQPNAGEDSLETSLAVPAGITASRIKVYVDTGRVQSWPEIDAVELVGTNGSRQWASNSRASASHSEVFYDEPSSGEENGPKAGVSTGPAPKPPGQDAVSGALPLK
ncbi:MAG TPA: hypothetical protein VG796_13090 [Verrucomicrobiales bacterium]|nr:hypothetical protein [Verrucomicrobiales bacterium]